MTQDKETVLTLIFLNANDGVLGERGLLSSSECRGCILDAVVSAEVSHLCLPRFAIQKLGLEHLGRMDAQSPTGIRKVDLYGWVRFDVDGGIDGVYRCIEISESSDKATPAEHRAILGRIPLLDMGLELDSESQVLNRIPIRA